jgi:hypothetical protein
MIEYFLRLGQYSNMYNGYLELASYFLKSDDRWLSDSFYEKSLSVAQTHPQLDPQLAAEAHLNVGLAYERRGSLKSIKKLTKILNYSRRFNESIA